MEDVQRFPIETQADVEVARRAARTLATTLGFGTADVERVVLATLELATNLRRYAVRGELILRPAEFGGHGLRIESRDAGPGIADLDAALRDGVSTGDGLGSGLAGVRRLMDEMTITTASRGTSIVVHKWLTNR
ncbi:MAG TPA: ATP-binding protein [Chloroflexota bacterium]|nr:ATP-binding protein [Chloroflexota bacterium]